MSRSTYNLPKKHLVNGIFGRKFHRGFGILKCIGFLLVLCQNQRNYEIGRGLVRVLCIQIIGRAPSLIILAVLSQFGNPGKFNCKLPFE